MTAPTVIDRPRAAPQTGAAPSAQPEPAHEPVHEPVPTAAAPPVDPMDPRHMPTLRHWHPAAAPAADGNAVIVDCGWGRLLLGQTFADTDALVQALADEAPQCRDVAMYVRDPHVVVARSPQQLFLDPSHAYRLPLQRTRLPAPLRVGWRVRDAQPADEAAINRVLHTRRMVPVKPGFLSRRALDASLSLLVAEEIDGGQVVGVVTGVDHVLACGDAEGGTSLWSLAVDPQCLRHGIGLALVAELARRYRAAGRHYMDLSVMHDNTEAIRLYEKLGFERVPVYCVKNRNPINERLYVGPEIDDGLNVYAQIIVDEARRRGIHAEVLDAEFGYFRLSFGGRSINCRESLSDLTSAVAMSRCDDKRVTRRVLEAGVVRTPAQITVRDDDTGGRRCRPSWPRTRGWSSSRRAASRARASPWTSAARTPCRRPSPRRATSATTCWSRNWCPARTCASSSSTTRWSPPPPAAPRRWWATAAATCAR
jgi:ribosomal protein S18 acetylase RimI-like enzyme